MFRRARGLGILAVEAALLLNVGCAGISANSKPDLDISKTDLYQNVNGTEQSQDGAKNATSFTHSLSKCAHNTLYGLSKIADIPTSLASDPRENLHDPNLGKGVSFSDVGSGASLAYSAAMTSAPIVGAGVNLGRNLYGVTKQEVEGKGPLGVVTGPSIVVVRLVQNAGFSALRVIDGLASIFGADTGLQEKVLNAVDPQDGDPEANNATASVPEVYVHTAQRATAPNATITPDGFSEGDKHEDQGGMIVVETKPKTTPTQAKNVSHSRRTTQHGPRM